MQIFVKNGPLSLPSIRLQLNPKPARRYRAYSHTALTDAYMAVKDGGLAVTKAAIQYRVPEQTLRDRVLGKVNLDCVSSGTSPVLTIDEEAKIVHHLRNMASYGYGYTRQEIVDIATDYALQLGKRPQDKPFTLNWFLRFIVRWPELRVLKPRAHEQRAKCTSESVVSSYFVNSNVLSRNKISKTSLILSLMLMKRESRRTTALLT